jgi:hypothetical protein
MKKYYFYFIVIFLIGVFTYKFIYRKVEERLLKKEGVEVTAIIIDEKNFFGNSPVSHDFSYSYSFTIDGKVYKGDSSDMKFKVGDTIRVRYVKSFPTMNEPILQ